MLAPYAVTVSLVSPSVCSSVRLSQAGIVQKPLNIESRKQRHTIAQGLHFSADAKFDGGAKCRWVV